MFVIVIAVVIVAVVVWRLLHNHFMKFALGILTSQRGDEEGPSVEQYLNCIRVSIIYISQAICCSCCKLSNLFTLCILLLLLFVVVVNLEPRVELSAHKLRSSRDQLFQYLQRLKQF